jgi:hypothetical protein
MLARTDSPPDEVDEALDFYARAMANLSSPVARKTVTASTRKLQP